MAITATPIILNKKVIGLIEIIRYITREKEIDKAKTEFVSLAAHQPRTTIAIIGCNTEIISKSDARKILPHQKNILKKFKEVLNEWLIW